MNTEPEPLPPPVSGWFEDPWDTSQSRYWDGTEWTEHTQPGIETVPEEPLGELVAQGAKKLWAQTLIASGKARHAAGPVLRASAVKAQEAWEKSSAALEARRQTLPNRPNPVAVSSDTPLDQLPPPGPRPPSRPGVPAASAPTSSRKWRGARPLTQHFAVLCWSIAGLLSVLNPVITVLMLNTQYQGFKDGSDIDAEWFTAGEQFAADVGGQAFGWVAGLFIVSSVITLVLYVLVIAGVSAGSTTARVWGTVFSVISIPGLVGTTFTQQRLSQMLAWADLDALTFTNVSFPAILFLHLLGVFFVWLPPTNEYARRKQYQKLSRRYPTY